ncbi:MAG: type II toxin-antitoxin system Phd/YefM family antitoxin [Candidatus Aminicenantes bacterium]|nr:type II toxin-antitoxin system Phd/YefM family antitoxin [Candidatus Aminicenantes bacterium]
MAEEKIVSATEAVRKFSELLNFVRYKGENYTVVRGGKPVAVLRPVEMAPEAPPHAEFEAKSLSEFKKLMKNLPKLGAEVENFERDIKKVLQFQPSLPKKSPWE